MGHSLSEDLERMHAINTDSVGELYNGIGRIDDLETMAKKLAQEKINSIIGFDPIGPDTFSRLGL
ncbi:hypothetical protein KAM339_010770 [Aeromonas caviae]|nr:hypothetical protein KAM339_010770 [Aeromonas caviae]